MSGPGAGLRRGGARVVIVQPHPADLGEVPGRQSISRGRGQRCAHSIASAGTGRPNPAPPYIHSAPPPSLIACPPPARASPPNRCIRLPALRAPPPELSPTPPTS